MPDILDIIEQQFELLRNGQQTSIEADIRDPHLTDDSGGLDWCETQVAVRGKLGIQELTMSAWHAYLIMANRLWRHRLDDDGQPLYRDQNHYLSTRLVELMPWHRSTSYRYRRGFLLAQQTGFVDEETGWPDPAQIIDLGGITYLASAAERLKMAPDGRLLEKEADEVRQVLLDAAPGYSSVSASDWTSRLHRGLTDEPYIWFEAFIPHGRAGHIDFVWKMVRHNQQGENLPVEQGLLSDEVPPPPAVVAKACRLLRARNPYTPTEE
jgi:hypothetical protein